ncbi:hypothetical protein BDV06DRAFT_187681 [Aspergillus oleicola]
MHPRLNIISSLTRTRAFPLRTLSTSIPRLNTGMPPHPSPQQPNQQQQQEQHQQPNAYKDGMSRYRTFFGPYAKVFLGAVFVYQVIYWSWMKLEMEDVKVGKNEQLKALEKEARELTGVKK